MQFRFGFSCCLYFHGWSGGWLGGWVGGWSEEWRVMLNSTQDQIKLKLKFELSLAIAIFVWSLRQSNITWLVALASMYGASEHKQAL